jgi:hypothetical protein
MVGSKTWLQRYGKKTENKQNRGAKITFQGKNLHFSVTFLTFAR